MIHPHFKTGIQAGPEIPKPGGDPGLVMSRADPSPFLLLPGLTLFQTDLVCLVQGQRQKVVGCCLSSLHAVPSVTNISLST